MSEDRAENIQEPEEEQVLFHTHTVYTRETMIEMTKNGRKIFVVIKAVLFILVLFCAVGLIFLKDYITAGAVVVILGLIAAREISLPRRVVERSCWQHKSLYGRNLEIDLYFGERAILDVNTHTGGKVTLRYENLTEIRRTKNLYLLYMKEKMLIFFRKDDFITGDAGSFERFIADRCPTAKRNFLRSKK